MRFKIAICDDDLAYCDRIRNICETNIQKYTDEYEIHMYDSGSTVIKALENGYEADVVFMDIQMKEMSGLSAAERIRAGFHRTSVVLVTQYIDFAMEGYKVNAFRYIMKDDGKFEKEIDECLKQIYDNKQRELDKKKIYLAEKDLWINTSDIVYIERDKHNVRFHVIVDGEEMIDTYRTAIVDIETMLNDDNFLRIHQSYIVNCRFILGMTTEHVVLYNKTKLNIARRRYKEIVKEYMRYKGQEI